MPLMHVETSDPTPEQVAAWLAEQSSDSQAKFFHELACLSAGWTRLRVFQLQAIVDSPYWSERARELWSDFGQYSARVSS